MSSVPAAAPPLRPPPRARPGSGRCSSPSRSAPWPPSPSASTAGCTPRPGRPINLAGFSSGLAVKSFLATVAMVLAVVQTVTAMAMFGRIPLSGAWVGPVHRWSGRVAVGGHRARGRALPLRPGLPDLRHADALHSLFGCFFYGAFVGKMLILTRDDSPKWALPLMGGLVLSGLTALWMTAALWFYLNS